MMKTSTARQVTLPALICLLAALFSGCVSTGNWRGRVDTELPAFGHRNWIVIADSAYPKQSADGIETIVTGASHLEVLDYVLKQIETAPHVQANILVDAELESVSEEDAPGVSAYRTRLNELLEGRKVERMIHEEIIARLDKGAQMFNILLLKTSLTIPYTSVFLELDCGYWNAEKEKRLREAFRATGAR
jgi:L-fucose mutarotase/ribose pyranase (RbsD/FucU family)